MFGAEEGEADMPVVPGHQLCEGRKRREERRRRRKGGEGGREQHHASRSDIGGAGADTAGKKNKTKGGREEGEKGTPMKTMVDVAKYTQNCHIQTHILLKFHSIWCCFPRPNWL